MKRRICPECGQIVSEYTFFCTECGSKTVEDDGTVRTKTDQFEKNKEESRNIQENQTLNNQERFDGSGKGTEEEIRGGDSGAFSGSSATGSFDGNQLYGSGGGQDQGTNGKKWIAVLAGVIVCLCIVIVVLLLPRKSKKDSGLEEQSEMASVGAKEDTEEIQETDLTEEEDGNDTEDYDETEDYNDAEDYDETEDDNDTEDYDETEEEIDDTENYEDTEENDETEIHEYELFVDDVSWSEAYQACLDRGGYLVRINTEEEYDEILDQIYGEEKENIKFWIGGARGKDRKYHWVYGEDKEFGEDILNKDSQYMDYWLEGEPSFVDEATDTKENRMNMFYMKNLDEWVWNDVPDDILEAASFYAGTIGYICEYE